MKPTSIFQILDLAQEARKKGEVFNPIFTGEAGLGKSQICQQWVKQQRKTDPNFGFVDLRIAYMEAPDLIGLPENEVAEDGIKVTSHYLPDFWPRNPNSRGLLLLEEPNRGTTGVMNCLMQLLTDRQVHKYNLPEGWIIAACINPDSSEYEVNAMDAALRDRFEEFEIEYDSNTFMKFIEDAQWDENLVRFISSGMWIYKSTKEIAKGAKYISPRTLSKMNAAERAGAANNRQLHWETCLSVLGKDIGKEYFKFRFDQAPVTAQDLLKDKAAALKRLKQQSSKDDYKGDMISATVESVTKHYGGLKKDCKADEIDEDTMAEVAKIIPADQAVNLVKQCGFKQAKGQVSTFFKEFGTRHPDLLKILKDNIALDKATGQNR